MRGRKRRSSRQCAKSGSYLNSCQRRCSRTGALALLLCVLFRWPQTKLPQLRKVSWQCARSGSYLNSCQRMCSCQRFGICFAPPKQHVRFIPLAADQASAIEEGSLAKRQPLLTVVSGCVRAVRALVRRQSSAFEAFFLAMRQVWLLSSWERGFILHCSSEDGYPPQSAAAERRLASRTGPRRRTGYHFLFSERAAVMPRSAQKGAS